MNGEAWEEVKERIYKEKKLSLIEYTTWIQPLKFREMQGEKVIIEAPVGKEYIQKKYGEMIREIISVLLKNDYDVEFVGL